MHKWRQSIRNAVLGGALVLAASAAPVPARAAVHVGIGISLPPLVLSAPPAMVVVPGSYVYYPPEVGVEIFFYHGNWYRPYRGGWYVSGHYNGPWQSVERRRVPRMVREVPPAYRKMPRHYAPVPYGQVRQHWRAWERDRHWDRRGPGPQHEGRGRGRRGHEERGRGR